MTTTLTKHERNLGAIIHASTFSKYIFPFGNFIVPLVLWAANKENYKFIDYNGKQALNFQISILLYALILGIFSVPLILGFIPNLWEGGVFSLDELDHINKLHFNFDGRYRGNGWLLIPIGVAGLLQIALFIVNLVFTILATIRTNEGKYFKYPITIPFIK